MYHQVPFEISKQEDGLWRVEAPGLQGCWVDEPTLAEAISEIQEVIAMMIDIYEEKGSPLPQEISTKADLPLKATIPVAVTEHKFRRVSKPAKNKRR
ncbi:MAG: type II toxin-antitoxin system HicB family antitoxin [Dehalococcoidia bacterium]|nr:type II toxin-antitoxin system HicB family antitoxin [Dehalococcoidia bacterium]